MRTRFFSLFDYVLFGAMLFLTIIGILFIYSAGFDSDGVLKSREYIKQIVWASIGLVILVFVSFFDYRKIKPFAIYLYAFFLVMLITVLITARVKHGAASWFGSKRFGIQPSEFGKIIYIIFLAWYLERSEKKNDFLRFLVCLVSLALPVGFILLQPDMGTASVYIPIFLVMCFFAGLPLRYILMCLFFGLLTIFFTILPVWETEILRKNVLILNILTDQKLRLILIATFGLITALSAMGYYFFKKKYYYWIAYCCGIFTFALIASIVLGKFMKDYQIKRLLVFIDPSIDPKNEGWNIIQAKTAVGSGGFWGKGFLLGTLTHGKFVPEKNTDFIFCILGEEWGFAGSCFAILLYLVILVRGFFIIKRTTDVYGSYIAIGVSTMIAYHFFVNVGMVMGIMPITGIPLLFISYGGSALWTAMIGIGLLESVNIRRLEIY